MKTAGSHLGAGRFRLRASSVDLPALAIENGPVERSRAKDWLRQAKDDLRFARSALNGSFYAQCCFICQQAAEKALKSALYARGAKVVWTHSLVRLCDLLGLEKEARESAGRLDQYYVSGRYPDALPSGAPFEVFTRKQAAEAVRLAGRLVRTATSYHPKRKRRR
jgi:HEPN domain-containing protein